MKLLICTGDGDVNFYSNMTPAKGRFTRATAIWKTVRGTTTMYHDT